VGGDVGMTRIFSLINVLIIVNQASSSSSTRIAVVLAVLIALNSLPLFIEEDSLMVAFMEETGFLASVSAR
jgi:hypothetical protein